MKNLTLIVMLFVSLIFVFSACEDKNSGDSELGELVSAAYDSSSRTFTLIFRDGHEEAVPAIIEGSTASAILSDGTVVFVSDASVSGAATIILKQTLRYVNDWIYDNMSVYYLWNDKIPSKPNYALNPKSFFDSILNKYNKTTNPTGDRFSWIQENYVDLLNSLNGVSSDEIGFDYTFLYANEARTQYYAIVLYPRLNTDAHAKGIERGRFITQINGENITPSNYSSLFGGTGSKTLSMADWTLDTTTDTYRLTSSGDVTINMHAKYTENPVYLDSVYTINNKKIGYLVYNFFSTDSNDGSHAYDEDLMNALNRMKSKGATEMILDLRYNSGGAVSSALALASALAKNRSTNKILLTAEYNSIVHNEMIKIYGQDYNKEHFIDKIVVSQSKSIPIPAMNVDRLYVLTGSLTASASELIINGLKPHMGVTLIGETTYGKNVGSISLYEENDPKNKWGMQPIVVKYYNSAGESDFTAGFTPDFKIDELDVDNDGFIDPLYKFGSTDDPLLAKALSLISGILPRSAAPHIRSSQLNNKANLEMQDGKRFQLHDDIRGGAIRDLLKEHR